MTDKTSLPEVVYAAIVSGFGWSKVVLSESPLASEPQGVYVPKAELDQVSAQNEERRLGSAIQSDTIASQAAHIKRLQECVRDLAEDLNLIRETGCTYLNKDSSIKWEQLIEECNEVATD